MSSNSRISSEIWYHFSKDGGKGKCRYCQAKVSMPGSSISNLKRHLKGKHPTISLNAGGMYTFARQMRFSGDSLSTGDEREVSPCQVQVSPSTSSHSLGLVFPSTSADSAEVDSARPICTVTSTSVDEFVIPAPHPLQQSQSVMSTCLDVVEPMPVNKRRLLDIQLLRMICKEYIPFSIVEEVEFKKFSQMLCPSYNLPSRQTSRSLLRSVYSELFIKVKAELAFSKAICVTCDGWTSVNNESFIALTAHFIDPRNTVLKSFLLECSEFEERHTEQSIAKWIDDVLKKFEVHFKVVAVVIDNAANMKAAVTTLRLRHVACFAHSLNLVVQGAISKSVGSTVEKVKTKVQFFKKNAHALAKLNEMQDNMLKVRLKLKQDVLTRWNSTWDMLQRFVKIKEPIISTLALLGVENELLDADWNDIEDSIKILTFFNEATNAVSGEKHVTLSYTVVLATLLARKVKAHMRNSINFSDNVKKLLNELLRGLTDQFGGRDSQELFGQSILLDPRFKSRGFTDHSNFISTYQGLLVKMKAAMAATSEQPHLLQPLRSTSTAQDEGDSVSKSIWDDIDSIFEKEQRNYDPTSAAIIEIDNYLAAVYLARTSDPLLWWESRKNAYPTLYSFVIKRLCIPASSVPCERIFSKAGQIYSEKRSRLKPNKVSEMMFLDQNLT